MAVKSVSTQSINISSGYLRAKRVFDVIFTLLMLIPLLIVFVIVAMCIWLDSEGPVFFRQKIGRAHV